MGRASSQQSGVVGIRGAATALDGGVRCVSASCGTEAIPGVVTSPGYSKVYWIDPRCTLLEGRHRPLGYVSPLKYPSSIGSEYMMTAAAPRSCAMYALTPR